MNAFYEAYSRSEQSERDSMLRVLEVLWEEDSLFLFLCHLTLLSCETINLLYFMFHL